MPYSITNRFPPPAKYFPFYDPGTYQFEKRKVKPNTVGFLMKSPRKTGPQVTLWTQANYDASLPHKIQNITVLKSTTKRFPYEALSTEDLNEIICQCEADMPCECPTTEDEAEDEVVCQGKVKRRLYKGHGPRSLYDDGKRVRVKKYFSPPFYDAPLKESTAFYQGCKWSRRTSKRSQATLEVRPGPADYTLEREPTEDEICAERVRAYKRKTCKQWRFIEMVQKQNILEGRPGPSAYHPTYPKGTDLHYLGPKAERFFTKSEVYPGPADHWLRRDFDPPEPLETPCQAKLPDPPFFGVKARRFIPKKEEGPSPASYSVSYKPCQFVHCPTTPFGSSAVRFKPDKFEESDDEDVTEKEETKPPCPTPTWEFKSKTIRMKPLVKIFNEASPADLPQSRHKIERNEKLQYNAPFYSSEGRFQPWFDWIAVHGTQKTPGPGTYKKEAQMCLPAYHHGPLFRAKRFSSSKYVSPAPNQYKVNGGIETILRTHNERLLKNIKNQHQYVWKQPVETTSLNPRERESILLQKCIALLEPEEEIPKKSRPVSARSTGRQDSKKSSDSAKKDDQKEKAKEEAKPKMLRTFLYSREIPIYF